MAFVNEIKSTQVYDWITVESNVISHNIVIVLRSYTLQEIRCDSILTKIGHCVMFFEILGIEVLSYKLMPNLTTI